MKLPERAHANPAHQVLSALEVDEKVGLDDAERRKRLEEFGPNSLPAAPPTSWFKLVWQQLASPLVALLLVTGTISLVTHQWLEGWLIYGIVAIMVVIGIILEHEAEAAVKKLEQLQTPTTQILQDGEVVTVAAADIVPGDILVLTTGNLIPADARIIVSHDVLTDEALLTGESTPVHKSARAVAAEVQLADQSNILFAGSVVVDGEVRAVVTATGRDTQLGKLAKTLSETTPLPTPLQLELRKVGRFLLLVTIVASIIVFVAFLARGETLWETVMMATALAVAFIPEGLTAILTISLALAVKELVRKQVIVRRLVAAEGLGSVTHVITDKTGTLTEGKMQVAKIFLDGKLFAVNDRSLSDQTGWQQLVDVVRFCTNNQGPTEEALVQFLSKKGLSYELEGRLVEYRFSSSVKRMSVIRQHKGNLHLFSKGAPEVLIPLCEYHAAKRGKKFTKEEQEAVLQAATNLASQGFRVLAIADKHKEVNPKHQRDTAEQKLSFIGLIALMDPIRPTVKSAVAGLKRAGLVPVVMSGDHPAIVAYIGHQAGILPNEHLDQVVTGRDLDELLGNNKPSRAVIKKLLSTQAFARVRPDHKIALVTIFQDAGYQVAMAGDGVNDATAVKKAHIGIAMANGSDLTKEVADVVLTGHYDAILRAVGVGRMVKQRLQLYLHFLLSDNASLLGLFAVAIIFGVPAPITPLVALVINILTDALPAIAMAVEPEDPSLIKSKHPIQSQAIISPAVMRGIVIQGLVVTLILGWLFVTTLDEGVVVARSLVFTCYVFMISWRCFTARSLTKSIRDYGLFTNKLMIWALISVLGSWAFIQYVVPGLFDLTAVPPQTLVWLLVLSPIPAAVESLTKWYNRRHLTS